MVWMRRYRWQAATAAVSPKGKSPADLAHKAFVHGNTCLMAGAFAEATTAFHQAQAFAPMHPHVAGRLAEVERQQQEARSMALAEATG